MTDAGIDPRSALRRHSSYEAHHLAGALLKTGLTGTNVADVVIAVRIWLVAGGWWLVAGGWWQT